MIRDLDARIVLGVRWAAPGRRVLVGSPQALLLAAERLAGGGLYLGKALFRGYRDQPEGPRSAADYRRVKARGFVVAHLEDEGALLAGSAEQRAHAAARIPALAYLDSDDTLCAWGTFDRDAYRQVRPDIAERVVVTGHPRFSLYRRPLRQVLQPDADALQRRFGRFVLLATTTARANPTAGFDRIFSPRCHYRPDDADARMAFVREWGHTVRQLARAVELVHRLAGRVDASIVVRPHPSEDEDLYHAALAGLARVHVVREGSVAPWIVACSALVQDGCTTALEGYLAGRPVLTYVPPSVDDAHRRPLASWVGTECASEQAVIDALDHALGDAPPPPPSPRATSDEARALLLQLDEHASDGAGDGLSALDALIEQRCSAVADGDRSDDDALVALGRRLALDRTRRQAGQVVHAARAAVAAARGDATRSLRSVTAERRYARDKQTALSAGDLDVRARRAADVLQRDDVTWRLLGDGLAVFEVRR